MVDEEADSGGSRGQCQVSGSQKQFWRSASWNGPPLPRDNGKSQIDMFDADKSANPFSGFPVPLTPRTQQNLKARSCLPPLQPLAINRRSLDDWPKPGSDDTGDWLQPPTPGAKKELGKSGEGLSLDLGSFEKNLVSSGSHIRRERLACFDKECSKVADHIYLGGDSVAKNREILRQHGITHVLNCVGFVCPEYFKSDLVYKTLWLHDSPSEDITSILYDVFDYFEDVREQGGRVLVHCCQGVSRSTSLVIAYLMWREGQSFDDAFQYVKAARGITNPNMGFACQLLQCQKRVHAVPLSPSSMVRMYRIAPHSPYDPLHLVPKLLSDPSVAALDSRGAFIVNIPSAIYVWIGKQCETVMARDAKAAAFQVVRYERADGPVVTIDEGDEPTEFWDAFPKSLLGENSSTNKEVAKENAESAVNVPVGLKKVDSYNLDFEIFHRALAGGVVPPFASSSGVGLETHLPDRENGWSILRRKFVRGNVKEWVSASKVVPSDNACTKVADTLVGNTRPLSSNNLSLPLSSWSSSSSFSSSIPPSLNLLFSSSSSSFSSSTPPSSNFLSSSLASDVNRDMRFNSESPFSPSKSESSTCTSPVLKVWRDSSVPSFEHRSLVSNNNELHDVDKIFRLSSQILSSSSKGPSCSLAQRRGNMSRSLTLPIFSNDSRTVENSSSACTACTSMPIDMMAESNKHNVVQQVSDSKRHDSYGDRESSGKYQKHACLGELGPARLSYNVGSLSSYCHAAQRSSDIDPSTSMWTQASDSVGPRVYQWPKAKQIDPRALDGGDFKSVLFVLKKGTDSLGRQEVETLNLWIGSQWESDGKWSDSDPDKSEVHEIDWKQVGNEFLREMGLPGDILVEVVREENHPDGFTYWLSSLGGGTKD